MRKELQELRWPSGWFQHHRCCRKHVQPVEPDGDATSQRFLELQGKTASPGRCQRHLCSWILVCSSKKWAKAPLVFISSCSKSCTWRPRRDPHPHIDWKLPEEKDSMQFLNNLHIIKTIFRIAQAWWTLCCCIYVPRTVCGKVSFVIAPERDLSQQLSSISQKYSSGMHCTPDPTPITKVEILQLQYPVPYASTKTWEILAACFSL